MGRAPSFDIRRRDFIELVGDATGAVIKGETHASGSTWTGDLHIVHS
jgi:hypothetical protein